MTRMTENLHTSKINIYILSNFILCLSENSILDFFNVPFCDRTIIGSMANQREGAEGEVGVGSVEVSAAGMKQYW